jgi:AraC family transcriptional regulator
MAFDEATESTRREYAARMNRVIDHIQKHLNDQLNLEHLAAIACFSPFHFHRLFRAWTGETLQAFVHRLRLERAAAELVFNRPMSITAIALDCGFSGSSAFARAFKEAFGVSATAWRNRKIRQTNRNSGESRCAVWLLLPSPICGIWAPTSEILRFFNGSSASSLGGLDRAGC